MAKKNPKKVKKVKKKEKKVVRNKNKRKKLDSERVLMNLVRLKFKESEGAAKKSQVSL